MQQIRNPTTPQVASKTTFRRKKVTAEEKAEKDQELARQAADAKRPRSPGLRSLYDTKVGTPLSLNDVCLAVVVANRIFQRLGSVESHSR